MKDLTVQALLAQAGVNQVSSAMYIAGAEAAADHRHRTVLVALATAHRQLAEAQIGAAEWAHTLVVSGREPGPRRELHSIPDPGANRE